MKRLFLPIALITFAVICLSIVHIDNVNKLDKKYNQLREKHEIENSLGTEITTVEKLDNNEKLDSK
ncbi:hypothetical protein ACWGOQ_0008395 [Aquimarina sp. M1]